MQLPPIPRLHTTPRAVAVLCALALGLAAPTAFAGGTATYDLTIEAPPGGHAEAVVTIGLDAGGFAPNGAGVALAFDSRALVFDRIEEVFPDNLLAVGEAPEPDEQDLDHNPDTDRLVRIAWLAPLGDWPANSTPTTLALIVFRTLPAAEGSIEDALTLTPLGRGAARSTAVVRRQSPAERRAQSRSDWLQHPTGTTTAGIADVSARSWSEETEKVPASCTLDVDGNASFDALTDGILIMRYLFGFSGSTLTMGAVGSGATRSDATAVVEFLGDSSCALMLDADGNGSRDALTDGILIARYLFGFSGTTLTANALGSGATRTDGTAVGSFLAVFRSSLPALVLQAPWLEAPLVSQIPVTLRVSAVYTGSSEVTYSLAIGPSGMTIDGATGALSWTPPASMEGQQANVKVTATDGTLSAEVTFAVRVAGGTQVTTSVSGSTVTVPYRDWRFRCPRRPRSRPRSSGCPRCLSPRPPRCQHRWSACPTSFAPPRCRRPAETSR